MVDLLTNTAMRSLAKWIDDSITSLSGVYIANPDFDWDRKRGVSGITTVPRTLPFVAIEHITESDLPFSISDGVMRERELILAVRVCCQRFSEQLLLPYTIKQSIVGAGIASGVTFNPGIPLYIGNVTSGTLNVETGDLTMHIPDLNDDRQNLKYSSTLIVSLDGFKDKDAHLIENIGNQP